jgi:dihydroneopterin aldolase
VRAVVHVRDLSVLCVLGVREHERAVPQRVLLDVDAAYSRPPADDALEEALDYSALARELSRTAREGRFLLAESLAAACCKAVLERFPHAESVRATVKKPHARPDARWVGATVEQSRE